MITWTEWQSVLFGFGWLCCITVVAFHVCFHALHVTLSSTIDVVVITGSRWLTWAHSYQRRWWGHGLHQLNHMTQLWLSVDIRKEFFSQETLCCGSAHQGENPVCLKLNKQRFFSCHCIRALSPSENEGRWTTEQIYTSACSLFVSVNVVMRFLTWFPPLQHLQSPAFPPPPSSPLKSVPVSGVDADISL